MLRLMLPLLALVAARDAPRVAFTIPSGHRLVEGIAGDGRTLWVSSVLDRTIVARTGGRIRTIAMPPGTLHPLGLAWDARREWLWIATDCPELPGVARCASGAVVAIDRRGRLRGSFTPAPGFHTGDIAVGGGAVFVSDTANGAVYRLNPETGVFDTLVAPGVGRSAQGLALDAEGRRLIVADYGRGIAAIDLATGERRLLALPDGKPLRGIDGLIRVGDAYYAILNGGTPAALVRFRLAEEGIAAEVLASGAPLTDPTQLVAAGGALLIVADAGWDAAMKGDAPRAAPAPVVRVPLPR